MNQFVFAIAIVAFVMTSIRQIMHFTWLWQVKEYRIDRIISHLKDNKKSLITDSVLYITAFLLVLYLCVQGFMALYLAVMFFVFVFIRLAGEFKKGLFKRPKMTIKAVLILSLTLFSYCLILFSLNSLTAPELVEMFKFQGNRIPFAISGHFVFQLDLISRNLIYFMLLYIIIPAVVTFTVLILNPIFTFQKERIIKKATKKIKRLKKTKTVGITGSYGKTSTKEFLHIMLKQKYNVVKTEGNNNTDIGVANTVIEKLGGDCDYFICELGAYKTGEIAKICDIVKPYIGILTGINEQHVDLFGSIANIAEAITK